MIEFLIGLNLTPYYTGLVWLGTALAVVWLAFMAHEPESRRLPAWQYAARRLAVGMMQGGMLCTVLFGTAANWVPWPPMLLVAAGIDLNLGMAILVSYRRCKAFGGLFEQQPAVNSR